MPLFKREIRFTGKHALIMQKYCKDKGGAQVVPFNVNDNDGHIQAIYLFETRAAIYLIAGLIGIVEKRKAQVDHSRPLGATSEPYSNIFTEMLEKQRRQFERLYQHMVLSEATPENIDSKVKMAFGLNKTDDECRDEQNRLEDYVRGGLEVIDEIFGQCTSYENVATAMFDLMDRLGLRDGEGY